MDINLVCLATHLDARPALGHRDESAYFAEMYSGWTVPAWLPIMAGRMAKAIHTLVRWHYHHPVRTA